MFEPSFVSYQALSVQCYTHQHFSSKRLCRRGIPPNHQTRPCPAACSSGVHASAASSNESFHAAASTTPPLYSSDAASVPEASPSKPSRVEQQNTPLLSAVINESSRVRVNLFCPGHKQGCAASVELHECVGPTALQHDVPELPALDNLFAPEGVIRDAQTRAAQTFIGPDADSSGWSTFFLVNGSTCGIEAAILACVRPGRRIALPRNAHQSAIHALVLSGADPVWIDPVYDEDADLLHGVSVESVKEAVAANRDVLDAVLVVSPTYHGVCSDISALSQVAHDCGVPLIVDEAHGAHFAFNESLPLTAASCGADVVVQSTHKTLGALTQSAMMHVRTSERVSHARIAASLQLVQSSSPSYLLLSSLDAARDSMAREGRALLQKAIDLAQQASQRIEAIDGFSVLSKSEHVHALDPTRVTVLLSQEVSGYDLDEHLIDRFGVYAELPSFRHITFIFTPGNCQEDVDTLVTSLSLFSATREYGRSPSLPKYAPFALGARALTGAMSPRAAFFADAECIPAESAIGRISADTLCPYPPGIPVVLPGERVTAECVAILRAVLEAGGSVSGAADESLETLRVVSKSDGTQH